MDLNYKMELISGQEVKLQCLKEEYLKFDNLFKNAGIMHVKDASAFLDNDKNVKKIFDFSIKEIELWHK